MSMLTGSDLLDALRRTGVLDTAKLDSLAHDPLAAGDPRALARELLRRDWLTPYQANQLLQGHGENLALGPYLLLERLGAGGMGQVFKARHRNLDRIVALKVIRKERLNNADAVRRFLREIRLAAQLSHPNIIVALNADEIDGTHLLVMEYVAGVDLARLVKQHGPLPAAQACAYIRQAALGLQHAHERGLIHRDIKPSNLLLSARDGTVKLLDLGLARQERTATEDESSTLTEDGLVMGTPDYMAPEQIEESRSVDIRADIYSLGCTLYHLLAGRPPFPGESAAKKLARHLTTEPPAIESLRPDLPPGVGVVLRKMMAKRPEQRYAMPAEVAAALMAALERAPLALPIAAPVLRAMPAADPFAALERADTEEGGRTSRQQRRRRRLDLRMAVLAAAILLGLVMLLLWGQLRQRKPPSSPGNEASSSLDLLGAEQVPELERFSSQPAELVAVLGNHGLRHEGENGTVTGVVCLPGGLGASISRSGLLCLWDLENGRERVRYVSSLAGQGLAFDREGVRLAISGNGIEVLSWNGTRFQRLFSLTDGTSFQAVAFSPDGNWLAGGGADGKLRLWNLRQAPPKLSVLEGHSKAMTGIIFAANGEEAFSCAEDGLVLRWQRDGQGWSKGAARRHESSLRAVALSPDGRTLAVGADDGWVSLWNLVENRDHPRSSFQAADQQCNALAFSPDGKFLAIAGKEHVALWTDLDRKQALETVTLKGHCSRILAVVFSSDGDTLLAGNDFNAVRLWRREGTAWNPHLAPTGHTSPIRGIAFAPDGAALASVAHSRSLLVWPLAAAEIGSPRRIGEVHPSPSALLYAPDGRTLAAAIYSGLQLWDPDGSGGTALRETLSTESAGAAVAFTPDGRTIAAACNDGGVRVWSLDGSPPRKPQSIKAGDKPLTAVALSPRGRKLAAAGSDGTVRLWTGAEGRWTPLGNVLQHPKQATAALFTPDAETVITACADGVVRLWDVRTTKLRTPAVLEPRHASAIRTAVLAPDGQTLAAIDIEGRLLWWDTTSWKKAGELRVPFTPRCLAFAPDGRHLATGNDNGTIYILRLTPPLPG